MDRPTMLGARSIGEEVVAFLSYFPLPGYGIVPINAFLLRAEQPVLVDTGYAGLRDDFMRELRSAIDLKELRWLWLTHLDPDHVGSLVQVLDEAPNARLVTTYLGMGKMLLLQLPIDRVYLLNPGQGLDIGDRTLLCLKPPTFDAPETTGFFDAGTRTLFSADSFGAVMQQPVESAWDIEPSALRQGLVTWSTIDAPWLQEVDGDKFTRSLDAVRALGAETVLSSHLPPAAGLTETLLEYMSQSPNAPPFRGPDQSVLEQMLQARQAA